VRGAGPGLEDVDHEMIAVLSGDHFVGCANDGVGEPGLETARFLVREGCRLLDPHRRDHEGGKWTQPADRKILGRAERLHPVERSRRNLLRA
jgi:hypothetical protein